MTLFGYIPEGSEEYHISEGDGVPPGLDDWDSVNSNSGPSSQLSVKGQMVSFDGTFMTQTPTGANETWLISDASQQSGFRMNNNPTAILTNSINEKTLDNGVDVETVHFIDNKMAIWDGPDPVIGQPTAQIHLRDTSSANVSEFLIESNTQGTGQERFNTVFLTGNSQNQMLALGTCGVEGAGCMVFGKQGGYGNMIFSKAQITVPQDGLVPIYTRQKVMEINGTTNDLKINTINELTLNSGVTIDSVILKDNTINCPDAYHNTLKSIGVNPLTVYTANGSSNYIHIYAGTTTTSTDSYVRIQGGNATNTSTGGNVDIRGGTSNGGIAGEITFTTAGVTRAKIAATGELKVNTIGEYTAAAGVTVDGVTLKDNMVYAATVNTNTLVARTAESPLNINTLAGGTNYISIKPGNTTTASNSYLALAAGNNTGGTAGGNLSISSGTGTPAGNIQFYIGASQVMEIDSTGISQDETITKALGLTAGGILRWMTPTASTVSTYYMQGQWQSGGINNTAADIRLTKIGNIVNVNIYPLVAVNTAVAFDNYQFVSYNTAVPVEYRPSTEFYQGGPLTYMIDALDTTYYKSGIFRIFPTGFIRIYGDYDRNWDWIAFANNGKDIGIYQCCCTYMVV